MTKTPWLKAMHRNWDLYMLVFPVVLYFIVFHYIPMYGVQIAFKDFIATKGIAGSPWVGFKHFARFFDSYYAWRLIRNTLGLSLYQLAVTFPVPIILALLINEIRNRRFRRILQTVTYAPHFLSTVVLVGLILTFLSPKNGMINLIIAAFGGEPIYFMTEEGWFKTIYVLSDVWQNTGWASIIYLAALAGIDPQLYEAAVMDGAGRLKRMIHITIPCLMPTATILLILNFGHVMSVGFEKVYLMQNNLNLETSEVISTYVYKNGLVGAQYSFTAAIGLFNSAVNFAMLLIVNGISKRVSQTSLW
ncbi:ABC transporter permease subunit [Paenibacillus doosanensis]|uniref:Multiple-sugar transport system permease YteP n=1 Tax=Paenibacillus konkukensis TaxID=2020716 RepID=A0ABY4RJ59_9BACL|nr:MULTISPECIES: ABC transporter permease subunit [Paenibacillus]MCS7462865.1 ABC transporter permease subunit [Paenibacillus doosanensis]UQZ82479.1 putative multiple-sugar transport system permease YteP [Paenibacillus konkukensis]